MILLFITTINAINTHYTFNNIKNNQVQKKLFKLI